MIRAGAFVFFFLFLPIIVFSQNHVATQIKSKLDLLATDKNFKIAGEKIHNIEYISNLYEKSEYHPFWTKSEFIADAVSSLQISYEDGLNPSDYHLEAIARLQKEIEALPGKNQADHTKKAELDLLLTDGIIFYSDHLLYGKIDPISLVPTWNFGYAPIPDLNPFTFKQSITNREIPARLIELRPHMPLYDTLLVFLSRYRNIAANGGWQPVLTGGKIEPGNSDVRIPAIRKRLLATNELSKKDSISSKLYDLELEKDIKAFQASHGLDADGVIGVGTFRELNVPVNARIESIRINLERVRWVASSMPSSYIIVNIASFWLLMVRDNQIIHTTPVVVGKPLNKTPVFRDRLRYIEFNPTWTQPTSIVKNETIPKMKKDTAYLVKNHMILLDTKGNLVPDSILDIKNLSTSRFPYLVRQEPGPWNALGEMKFMFPNKYDIYLHDTPSKSLFSRASRAYSHGCIRVKNPLDLAVKVLEGTDYNVEKIRSIIDSHETTRISLPEPLDILLMYWTCGIDLNGKLFFVPDIYERDLSMLKELEKPMH